MKLKKIKILFSMSIITASILLFVGCGYGKNVPGDESHKCKVDINRLLEYKNSYVGNNSSIGNIISNLPAQEYSKEFELQTDTEPYEININYSNFEEEGIVLNDESTISEPFSRILKKNSLIIFSLVKNADVINYIMDDGEVYTYYRPELADCYGDQYGRNFEKITEDYSSLNEFLGNSID